MVTMRSGVKSRASRTPSYSRAFIVAAGVLAGIAIAVPAGASGDGVVPGGASSEEGTIYYDAGQPVPDGAEQVSCDSAALPDPYAEPEAGDTVESEESINPDGSAYDTFEEDEASGSSPDASPSADETDAPDSGSPDVYPAGAAVCDAATAAAALPLYARGFNTRQLVDWALTGDDGLVDTAFDEMTRTRSRVHRLTVFWWDVQPAEGGPFNWSKYDRVVDAAVAHHFQLILNPMGSPNWARHPERRVPDEEGRIFRKNSYPDMEYWGAWDTFVRTMAEHYGAKAFAYEIWNEENSRPFWDVDPDPNNHDYEVQSPDPAKFTSLFCRAAQQIRSVRSGAVVGIGGLTARRRTWNDEHGVRELRSSIYLNRAYDAGIAGCNPRFVAYHPYVYKSYCGANPSMASTPGMRELGSVRNAMVEHGQGDRKIWMTEWSVPSRPFVNGKTTCDYSAAKQASLIGREHNYIRTRQNVRYSIYFNYRDAPGDSLHDFNRSVGLARVNWSRKPSWSTWRALAQTKNW
jgi:Beta-galactosidase